MKILNQDLILNFIDSNNLDTFPKTLMLEGPKGGGKHLITNYIADKFGLTVVDISEKLNLDTINEIYLKVEPFLYLIDCDKITVKNENTILKFLEEPLKNAFIVLLTTNKYNQICTIRNRCYCLTLNPYNVNCLRQFMDIENDNDNELVLEIAKTPGDVQLLQSYNLKELFEFGNKIFDKINLATYANTLSISSRLAFEREKNKYDVDLFWKILLNISYDRMIKNYPRAFEDYWLTNDYIKKCKTRGVNKKYLFVRYLFELKGVN